MEYSLKKKSLNARERNGTKGNKKKEEKKSQSAVIIDGRMWILNHLPVLNDVCMQICG